ncbi:serine phosphatase RsbU (regulator of sigma subunit) [Motilibacter rhizosphaerae]|uniref:Serine phosphatase RsbU (Regulator of sigma subunit) n=1 Tax=Motilibacter rhizosphaerae TaxID=598652 RepID=A0A4Q7NUR0_9ACTN|nr:SpoIIE family protein phosphatase [Motilibacter rhizosphaerae]RZS90907.1 serine phosphatase RsbU (regulator of sigma subunit) [Motilibacter rhizosphaerae]
MAASGELAVPTLPAGVRAGRQYVEREVMARGAQAVADDAALVAAELLANAIQHGLPPVYVRVAGDADCIRVEVRDADPRSPVRPAPSTSNMTGRGLALVEAVSARWGVERGGEGGKVVWAELRSGAAAHEDALDVDALLASWQDDQAAAGQRSTVVLGDVPTDLLIAAKAHIDNLVREFSLAARARQGDAVPEDLARLIETVVHGFAEARDAIKRQALAAARRGEPRTRLALDLPVSAAAAGEAYLAALDEADTYSRAARLLTLETPPSHRLFRRWYVEAVVHQLQELAHGLRPEPVTPFESVLVDEVERLAGLQRVTGDAARLQRVTAALARARTPEDVADVVVSEGVAALGASGGGLLVRAADGEHLAVPGTVGYGAELVDTLREERVDAPLPAATALRTGHPVWLESRRERDDRFPALQGFEAGTVSMCAVPLIVGDRVLGALRFSFASRRLFGEQERAFVLALASLTAATLLRTELYAAERAAALDLQRALLPERIPDVKGWSVVSHYSPAGGEGAGGDFYDVLTLVDGRVVALVGDVMGRGVEAAAAMAQVRTVLRAYAIADPDPVAVFDKVDHFFAVADLSQLVTVLYLLVDPGTGRVEVGNAGHLPPVLVDDSGSHLVDTRRGTPFGVDDPERASSALELPPGSALVLVTDGLVERRGEDIDRGIGRALGAVPGPGGRLPGALLADLLAACAEPAGHDDDVTVLVLGREG